MNVIPLLFEDHTLSNFRPLGWSQPTFENRVGMFCLRERVGHLAANPDRKGGLLARPMLAGLQMASGWSDGPEAVKEMLEQAETTVLWLNGRNALSHQEIRELVNRAGQGQHFFLQDSQGAVAFTTQTSKAMSVMASWQTWEDSVAALGCWASPQLEVPRWEPPLDLAAEATEGALQWIWQIVPATPAALAADLAFLASGFTYRREPFAVLPAAAADGAVWTEPTSLSVYSPEGGKAGRGPAVENVEQVFCGPGVKISPTAALDATRGPIILDREVTVMPGAFLEGPLYIGPGSTVKAGATIYGESSFGIVNKLAGEIGESTFGDFSNKQHEGFIGHAVLGSWVNLGAMTTCSDLKNNYGPVRVDLGQGQIDTGQRFVGLLMGDHAKTAIGSLFNTGTSVGFASNIFGGGMPPKFVTNFSWGGHQGSPAYGVERALQTAEVVMGRRGCQLTADHQRLFQLLSTS